MGLTLDHIECFFWIQWFNDVRSFMSLYLNIWSWWFSSWQECDKHEHMNKWILLLVLSAFWSNTAGTFSPHMWNMNVLEINVIHSEVLYSGVFVKCQKPIFILLPGCQIMSLLTVRLCWWKEAKMCWDFFFLYMCSESLVLKTHLYFLVWGNSFFGLKERSFGLLAKSLFLKKKIDKLFLKVQSIWMVQDLSVFFSSTSFFGFIRLHSLSFVRNAWHGAVWKKIQFLLDLKIA